MRLLPRVFIPLAMFMLLIGYQNFSTPTDSDWDSQTPLKIIQEMQNFERNDPGVPDQLAVPQGGSDLESVRNNWAERQSKLLLNGFDKKVENAINDTLNSYVAALFESNSEEAEAPQLASPQRDPAEVRPHALTQYQPSPVAGISAGTVETEKSTQKPRHLIKFPRPNMIKYEVSETASFNFVANPGETRLNYSQAYNERTKLGIEHTTAGQSTQMFLKYDW